MASQDIDVAVIGGGPAGISACLELARASDLKVALFETGAELGGMPRSCHFFFGMRDRWRLFTGPQYALKMNNLVRKTSTAIYTDTHVLAVKAGSRGAPHRVEVLSSDNFQSFAARFIILAVGCSETSAGARQLPSQRPAGIYTTGALQQLVNIYNQIPGKRALVIGSEHIALSSLITLKRAGMAVAGMVEEGCALKTYRLAADSLRTFYRFPIYLNTSVKRILGKQRVEGVELVQKKDGEVFRVACDTVIVTGKFRPDSQLLDDTSIEMDPDSQGPLVDMNLMTSIPNIYAAGNILRGANMHDLCALEGKAVARSILHRAQSRETFFEEGIRIRVEAPIRYVVPQKVKPVDSKPHLFPRLYPGPSFQLECTLTHPTVEAWSGAEIIWRKSFKKLIANNRVLLPVYRFDWGRVNVDKGILLKIKHTKNKTLE